jgi:hypothetical protein
MTKAAAAMRHEHSHACQQVRSIHVPNNAGMMLHASSPTGCSMQQAATSTWQSITTRKAVHQRHQQPECKHAATMLLTKAQQKATSNI